MLKSLLVITRFVLLMCCPQQHFFIHCKQFQLSHQLLYKDLRPQQEEGRERESMPHGSWDQFTWNENLPNNTSIKITHKPDGFVTVFHERKTGKKK
jgi:hypothetical protein